MDFKTLYKNVNDYVAANGVPPKPVTFEFLRAQVTQDNSLIEQLDVWRVTYKVPTREARFTLFDERDSQFDDPKYFAEICFCSSLEEIPDHLLFALTNPFIPLTHVSNIAIEWAWKRNRPLPALNSRFASSLNASPMRMPA